MESSGQGMRFKVSGRKVILSGLVFVLGLVSGLGVNRLTDFARHVGNSAAGREKSIGGRWHGDWPQGKLDTKASLPAIDLTVQGNEGDWSGTVVFYAVKNVGDGPKVVGKAELPLVETSFSGDTLSFKIPNRVAAREGSAGDGGGLIEGTVRLTGDNEAEFVLKGDKRSQPFRLVRD